MFVDTYQCDNCSFLGHARFGEIGYYVFSDGEQMPASTSAAWCRQCKNFTSAERLPPIESILEEVKRLRSNQTNDFDARMAELCGRSLEEHVSFHLAFLTNLDFRFHNRQSANRCVECGGTDFDYIADEEGRMPEELPHANCQGTLRRVNTVHASPASYFMLDSEGNRIPVTSPAT